MTGDTEMRFSASADMDNAIDVGHYRKLVRVFVDMRRYQTALFWAEKVCVLTLNNPNDLYWLAQCMYLLGEYQRAAHTIRFHGLEKIHLPCYNLLLECLYEAKEWNEAVNIITSIDVELLTTSLLNQQLDGKAQSTHNQSLYNGDEIEKNEVLASINLLKGKIYDAMDNRGLAMDFYIQALHKSVHCYEALEALVHHEMLMAWEEKELIQHLPLAQQATEAETKLIIKLYESKVKKYCETQANPEETISSNFFSLKSIKELTERVQKNRSSESNLHRNALPKTITTTQMQIMSPANKVLEDLKNTSFSLQLSLTRASNVNESHRTRAPTPQRNTSSKETDSLNILPLATCLSRLNKSTDIMAAEAEKFFYDCEYKKSFKILNELLKIDPYHNAGLTVQIGCLMEFGDYNKLFYIAHKLVDQYPDKAISWYAVGCYYDLIGKSEPARRYLSKATTLDRLYGPAWLAYGHSFAKEKLHDQAMAAYFKATQLMRGCHLPLLYIGVECGLTKNLELAEKFFYQAMSVAPLDVFVLHELGVIKYEYDFFESAEEIFRTTADIVTSRAKLNKEEVSSRWEPLFNNLGHCCRKTKKYQEALDYHQFALLLKPQSAQTYTSIGFVYALMGNLEEAITYFHKSLYINRDCIVTSTILKTCIEDLLDEEKVIDDICGNDPAIAAAASIAKSSIKRLPTIEESPANYSRIKIKLVEDSLSGNSDNIDANVIMDISMDL